MITREPHARRRLLAIVVAATYFGWAWMSFAWLWALAYDSGRVSDSEWWAIEGVSVVHGVAILCPAVLILVLSLAVLFSRKRSLIAFAITLCGVQIPLLLTTVVREAGTMVEVILIAAAAGVAATAVFLGISYLRARQRLCES